MFSGHAFSQSGSTTVSPSSSGSARLIPAVPMAFEENDGQLAPDLAYLGRAKSYSVAIERDGMRFLISGSGSESTRNSTIDVRFAESRGGSPVSLSGVAYRSNYFIGPDRSQWHEGVANFSRVGIRGIYPGIDTEFYDKDGELEHDFVLAPGADAKTIRLDLDSEQHVTLNAQGDAVIPAGSGELRFRKPLAYQFDGNGKRVAVEASYRLEKNSLRFTLGSYDHSRTLVIDPVIVFATYISGTAGSTPAQLATDGAGTLFLVGSTTNVNGFPALPSGHHPTSILNGGSKDIFVASLATAPLGSSLSWLTFLGNAGASTGLAIAYSGHTTSIYIGGTTSASGFPGAPTSAPGATAPGSFGGTFSSAAGSVSGFVSSLSSATGAGPVTTYISSSGASPSVVDTTTVTGLAADPATGNVYISGYGLGVGLPSVNQLGPAAAGEGSIVPANPGTTNNAFVIELDSNLDTKAKLVTYLQSATALDYKATAIQIDAATVPNIYVGGQVFGTGSTITFPTSQSFTAAGVYSGNDFGNCGKTTPNPGAFLAQIVPPTGSNVNSTIGFSALTCGDGADHANALAFGSDIFLVGDTTSTDFAGKVMYSVGATTNSASFPSSLQSTMAGTNANGFAMAVPASGGSIGVPSAFTYLGGTSGTTILLGAATDSSNSGLLQLAGSTTAKRADMPGTGATPLPSGQDTSATQAAGATRGLLYTLSSDLTTAKSISYFGYASSNAKAVSAQADGAGNAFVLVDDTVTGTTAPFSFTNAAAIESTPAAADNAYVAEVQGTAVTATPAGLALAVHANSPQIDNVPCSSQLACVITYNNSSDFSTIVYTWDLNLASPADNVVMNFPEQDAFLSSSAPPNPAYTIEADSGATALTCLSRQNSNGTTCTFASPLSAGSHTVALTATAGTNAQSMVGTSFQFDGNAADAEGEFVDAPQTSVTIANPVSITAGLTPSLSTVDAAGSTTDTGSAGHTTVITYTAAVKNTSTNDSKYTTLKVTLPAAFHITTPPTVSGATSSTCDLVGGTGCTQADVPAGATLSYSFSGIYLGSALTGANADGSFTEAVKVDASALPQSANSTSSASTNTTVHGFAALTVAFTAVPTPPAGAAAFNLGAGISGTPLSYVLTVSNAGPNAANGVGLTNVLPQGWRVASTSGVTTSVTNGATASCSSATACTMSLPSTGTVTITINGGFFDTATPDTAPVAAVSSTQASNNTIKDQATLSLPTGIYNPNATSVTSTAITVQRLTHLVFALTSSGTQAVGAPAGANYNLSNTNKVNYNYSIVNNGPDIAINVPITNTFTPPATYPNPPAGYVQQSTVPSGVTCSSATAPAFSTCTIASLAPNTNAIALPYLFPDNPPGNTYPVTVEVSAVSIAASSAAYTYGTGYGTSTQPAYSNSVDSNPTGTTNGDGKASTAFTIYRSNHLVLTLANTGTASKSGASPSGYDLGTQVTYAYTLVNQGPNYAINVPLMDTLTITTPASYTVPANAYTITPPTPGSAACTASPLYQTCHVANIAPTNTSINAFSVMVTYPDNPIASVATQDVSAIPSNINSAVYNYHANLNGAYGNAIDTNSGNTGNQSADSPTYLYRTASISIDTTPAPTGPGPNCAGNKTPCLYMVNSTNFQDTAQYTVNITNHGPNIATQAEIAYALPAHFIPSAGVIAGVNPANLPCTLQTTAGNIEACQGYIPVGITTATLTSQFDSNTVPPNTAFTDTNTPPNTPGSAQTLGIPGTSVSFAFGAAGGPANLPTLNVDRATHLVTVKQVASAPGNVSPNSVAAVNLDEKVAGDAQGKNDLVQVTLQIGNAGLNDALSVTVTDSLPPYFILTQKPATCSVPNGTPVDSFGNPMTGAAPITLTCTVATVPAGTGVAGTTGHHGTVTGAFAQIVYAGKFQDNGLAADIVSLCATSTTAPCNASPKPSAIAVVSFANAKAQSQDGIDLGDVANAGDSTSAAAAPLPVQRAAHLHFTLTQYVQPGDAALNAVGGVTGPGIAEAQLGANGGQVINPVRYQVKVTNDGPNFAPDPIVTTTLPLNPGGSATSFVHVAQSVEPSAVQGFPTVPTGCTGGQACQDAGLIATGGSILYNVDGNFDLNTLTEGNSGARIFSSAVGSPNVVDSNPTATTGGDQQTSLPITVVNTPVGANFTLAPFAASLTQPLNLKLSTVQIAGITGLAASGASPAPAVPMGVSPNPPDNGASVPLYRFGQGGVYYTLGTTAGVSAASTNSTQVCLTTIPDTFQKPERALLWALANAPTGTTFNTVPHFTSTATMGDITTIVLPTGGGSYIVPVTNTSYPPPPAQPQPAQVCGVLNGLANATNPTVLAVLEPVNFAPYIRTAVTAANSGNSQPGKGVTAAAAQVDLTISPQNNYDYNDADPCYTGDGGTTRSSCNDNVQLTTFLFGGGNLIGDAQQVHTYFFNDIQATPKPQFNLPAGQPQLYLVLADQLGAQGYKEMTSGGNTQVCDPGNPSTSYTPSTPACPLPNPLNGTSPAVPPLQTQLPLSGDTSVQVAQLIGNVGFGGSTGLIPLPQTPTPVATAHITAGQTAGFSWNWLTEQPSVQAVGNNTPPTLTLTCTSADGTDLAAKGIQCQVQQTYSYSTGTGNSYVITAPPAIYVVTTSNTAVGALHESPLSRDLHVVAAIVFPIGAIPLVVLLRRRKALKLSGWIAVIFFASLVGLSIGCGSGGFKNQGGTTTTATPAGTYEFIVTATGTDSNGNPINIKTYPFAVTVSPVQ